ncbi:unnamed protein product [Dicrocoelium dendriticum]|nr:unnamed protein product [Dicrocoelium dendriticum]
MYCYPVTFPGLLALLRMSRKLGLILFAISICTSFQFGYHTGVINAPLELISDFISNVTDSRYGTPEKAYVTTLTSFCVASFLISGILGALLSGVFANKLGRKKSVIILSLPCILGSILLMISLVSNSFELIIVGRLLIGLACGSYTGIGPMYMSEISPTSVRGASGVLNQLVIVSSILISQILGLSELMGTKQLWPYLLGLNIIPCVIGMVILFWCPESPRYLYLMKRDIMAAREALRKLRGSLADVQSEMDQLALEAETQAAKVSVFSLLKVQHLRRALCIAILAQMGQQLSGINGLFYYSVKLLTSLGLSNAQAAYVNIGIGCTLVAVTIVSVFIIDRLGRRVLLIGGFADACICLLVFSACIIGRKLGNVNWPIYMAIVFIYLFVCGFAIGPGSIPWFIVPELFGQETRDAALSTAITANWICNIIVALGFIQLVDYIDIYSFIPSACILLVIIVLLFLYLPETMNRSVASIESELKRPVRCSPRRYSYRSARSLESDVEVSVTRDGGPNEPEKQ